MRILCHNRSVIIILELDSRCNRHCRTYELRVSQRLLRPYGFAQLSQGPPPTRPLSISLSHSVSLCLFAHPPSLSISCYLFLHIYISLCLCLCLCLFFVSQCTSLFPLSLSLSSLSLSLSLTLSPYRASVHVGNPFPEDP